MKEKAQGMDSGQYIRVGTTLYKVVRRPLLSGDFVEERRPWNYETFRQDHGKDELAAIQKYDGFCSVPDHIDYRQSIGNFLNQYELVPYHPHEGNARSRKPCRNWMQPLNLFLFTEKHHPVRTVFV